MLYDGAEKYMKAKGQTQKLSCSIEWPICLYDFSIKQKIPNYFTFKVQQPLTSLFMDDYFTESREGGKFDPVEVQDSKDLLVERNHHLCTQHIHFATNFNNLLETESPAFFDCPLLNTLFD